MKREVIRKNLKHILEIMNTIDGFETLFIETADDNEKIKTILSLIEVQSALYPTKKIGIACCNDSYSLCRRKQFYMVDTFQVSKTQRDYQYGYDLIIAIDGISIMDIITRKQNPENSFAGEKVICIGSYTDLFEYCDAYLVANVPKIELPEESFVAATIAAAMDESKAETKRLIERLQNQRLIERLQNQEEV